MRKVSSTSRTGSGVGDRRSGRSANVRVPFAELADQQRDPLPLPLRLRTARDSRRVRSTRSASVCRADSCRRSSGASVEAECGDAAEDVGEAAAGDQRVAGRDERAMAEQQRRREVGDVEKRRLGSIRRPSSCFDPGRRVGARRAEARRDLAQQRAVRFVACRRRCAAARRWRCRSTAPRGARRSRAGTDRRRPIAPSRSPGA